MQVSIESSPFSEYVAFVTRYRGCISRPSFPFTTSYFAPPTRYLLLHRSSDITSALHLQGACTRGGRRSRVIYDYAREHDKPRHGGQKVDTTREGYVSRWPVLSWIDRYIDALTPVAPKSVDLSSPIALLPQGS